MDISKKRCKFSLNSVLEETRKTNVKVKDALAHEKIKCCLSRRIIKNFKSKLCIINTIVKINLFLKSNTFFTYFFIVLKGFLKDF